MVMMQVIRGCLEHGREGIDQRATLIHNDPRTGEQVEVPNPTFRKCRRCLAANASFRVGRAKLQKAEKIVRVNVSHDDDLFRADGTPDPDRMEKYLVWVLSDPIREIEFYSQNRHDKGTSRQARGVAIRAAIREPMLNGNPRQVTDALDPNPRKSRVPKAGLFKTIVVKPNAMATGKIAGWHARRWTVHTLKYAKGLVIVTDTNKESAIFTDWSSMQSAIRKSGWSILR